MGPIITPTLTELPDFDGVTLSKANMNEVNYDSSYFTYDDVGLGIAVTLASC
jgi:hypothetical protein